MKKILALVVAFVLCFTAVAGCFTATAEDAAVPTITIKDATAADGAIVIPVEGTNLQSVDSYLITVVLPADYTKIAVEGMELVGENGGDYAVNGTSVKILNEIEKLDTDNDGAIAFNVTATVPAVEADRVDEVTATVDAGNSDAQPVEVTIVPGDATIKAPVVEPPVTEPEVINLTIGKALSLKSSIQYAAVVGLTNEFKNSASVYAIFTKKALENGVMVDVASEPITGELNSNGYYYFYYDGIIACEMSHEITVVVYAADAEGNVCYKSQPYTSSILSYIASEASKPASSAEYKTLLADILVYGAAAQTYFNYNKANLVTEITDFYASATYPSVNVKQIVDDNATTTVPEMNNIAGHGNEEGFKLGNLLSLQSSVNLTYLIDKSQLPADTSNVKLKLSYNDGTNDVVREFGVEDFGEYSSAYYRLDYNEIIAVAFSTELTAAVYDGDVQLSKTRTYSIESYCAQQVAGNDANLAAVCTAIVNYGNSAYNYFY